MNRPWTALLIGLSVALLLPVGTSQILEPLLEPGSSSETPFQNQPEGSQVDDGLGDRLREEFGGPMMWMGLSGVLAPLAGLGIFALVTRYISPKEALKNPQRAMIYGFLKATPGAHLKQLSDEFGMKTSSILWHIRKLEGAQLVRSDRVNGYRVFYATEGGVEVKRLSRAITTLYNENARVIFECVVRYEGSTVKQLSERLGVQGGTIRWHLRKMREYGLIEEVLSEGGSAFYASQLGQKALQAAEGRPTTGTGSGSDSPAEA